MEAKTSREMQQVSSMSKAQGRCAVRRGMDALPQLSPLPFWSTLCVTWESMVEAANIMKKCLLHIVQS